MNRWVIKVERKGSWAVAGSVWNVPTGEAAVAKAREWGRHVIDPADNVRATDWWSASEADQEAAAYEDQLRPEEPGTPTPIQRGSAPKFPPTWAANLPQHVALTPYQLERLELIRVAVGASEIEFYLHIVSHPECSKMFQRRQYENARRAEPGHPDEYYFTVLILQRLEAARLSGGDLFDLRERFSDAVPIESQEVVGAVIEMIRARGWDSIDSVASAIAEYEGTRLPEMKGHPSTVDARQQITLILRERSNSS
jgi:hypothetical protein